MHIPDFIINNMYIDGQYYQQRFYTNLYGIFRICYNNLIKKALTYGDTFALYLIWYSIGRFFVEGLLDSLMLTETYVLLN